jgi:predicted RNA binding protein with dsRBD fold (UPF0201 family)
MKTTKIKVKPPLTKIVSNEQMMFLEVELEFLTDRINTQLEMIENLQAKLEALESDLAEHHIKEMARDEFKQILEDGEVVVSLDHLIS